MKLPIPLEELRTFYEPRHTCMHYKHLHCTLHACMQAVRTFPSVLITGSLPFLLDLSSALASSRLTGSFAVTTSVVMTCIARVKLQWSSIAHAKALHYSKKTAHAKVMQTANTFQSKRDSKQPTDIKLSKHSCYERDATPPKKI